MNCPYTVATATTVAIKHLELVGCAWPYHGLMGDVPFYLIEVFYSAINALCYAQSELTWFPVQNFSGFQLPVDEV